MLREDYTRGNSSFKTTSFIHSIITTPYKVEGEMRKVMCFSENIRKMDTEMSKDKFQSIV